MSRYDKEKALDKVADGLASLAADQVILENDDAYPAAEAQAVLDWVYERRHDRDLPVQGCLCNRCRTQ